MKKRILASIMISIAVLLSARCSFGNQTGTVGVDGGNKGEEVRQSILDSAEQDCQGIIETLNNNLESVRMYKADPALLNGIMVDYYGVPRPLNEIAIIRVESANILVIDPYDLSSLHSIEKAIRASGIDIAPENDGKRIKLTLPRLTGDLLRQLGKEISGHGDQAKIQIRNVRKAKLDELKKKVFSGDITQDAQNEIKNKLQETVNKYNTKVNEIVWEKQNELWERKSIGSIFRRQIGNSSANVSPGGRNDIWNGVNGKYLSRKKPVPFQK